MPKRINPAFVIEPIVKRYRYLFSGGKVMDVESPYGANSVDRELVLKEAHRRWGGKKDDWRIEGVTAIKEEPKDGGQDEPGDGGTTGASKGSRAGAAGVE